MDSAIYLRNIEFLIYKTYIVLFCVYLLSLGMTLFLFQGQIAIYACIIMTEKTMNLNNFSRMCDSINPRRNKD